MNEIELSMQPKLRTIDLQPQTHQGETYLMLQDPLALSEQSILLPQAIAPLLAYFDGERTIAEIASVYGNQIGASIAPEMVQSLVAALDECYLLDNERAEAARLAVVQAFEPGHARPMLIADRGYPADVHELHEFLNGYLPAPEPARNGDGPTGRQTQRYSGLLSPHIDYPRGGPIYGQVWQTVAENVQEAEAVVIFATNHYSTEPFTLTRQPYATPYGVLPNDPTLNHALRQALGDRNAFAGEMRHRQEHSIELVAVWLHHMRGGQACPIVPILCGGLHDYILDNKSPAEHEQVAAVLETVADHMHDRRILVVASGDLAHVGPAFRGKPLTAETRRTLRAADEELLDAMRLGDAEGFFQTISAVKDRNNVCGVMPIYLTMKLLNQMQGTIRGELTGYAECPADAQNTSVVTIAGVGFH